MKVSSAVMTTDDIDARLLIAREAPALSIWIIFVLSDQNVLPQARA
jgi:hypothetical protein